MKKKILFAMLIAMTITVTLFAKRDRPEAWAGDLYAKSPLSGSCVRLVNCSSCTSIRIQKGVGGAQGQITDANGNVHSLWADNNCTVDPVVFVP